MTPQSEREGFESGGCQSARCKLGKADKAADDVLLADSVKSGRGPTKARAKYQNTFKGKPFKTYLK